jgi:hypothetical protein
VHSGDLLQEVRQGFDSLRRTLSNLSAPIIKELHASSPLSDQESEEEGLVMPNRKPVKV